MSAVSIDAILEAAWSRLAPGRLPLPFPRGFWPDVARLAVEYERYGLDHEPIDWRPTVCGHGSWPERTSSPRGKSAGRGRSAKADAATRAANTAALLAAMRGEPNDN